MGTSNALTASLAQRAQAAHGQEGMGGVREPGQEDGVEEAAVQKLVSQPLCSVPTSEGTLQGHPR